jgi:tetratricopeptide (TPR) repeat protein
MKLRKDVFGVGLASLLIIMQMCMVLGQEPVKPPEGVGYGSDWLYTRHLDQVQGIMKMTDLKERERHLEIFTKGLHPETKILPYMQSFFVQTIADYEAAGQAAEAKALSEKMAQIFPDSPLIQAQAFQAAYQKGDHAKTIEIGEKIYAANPDQQVMIILAQSYIATNNTAKALEFSPKVVEAIGPKDGVYFLAWLAGYYAGQNDVPKAVAHYNKLLETFPSGAPQGWEQAQWNNQKATAYALRGGVAYDAKDYEGAIREYSESLKYFPHNDTAYFFIGLSHWRLQQMEQAEEAFAKAVVLNKATSAKAKEYLEQIYKPRHSDSLEGLDALLQKARASLNL